MSMAESLVTSGFPDIQGSSDVRAVAIDEVGVADLSYPICVVDATGARQHTIATCELVVALPETERGTHMSRFVSLLDEHAASISIGSFTAMAGSMLDRLGAVRGRIAMCFPYFLARRAPVSGLEGMVRFEGRVEAVATEDETRLSVGVRVPVTSLCPCSKEISDYGAHNQRGYVDIDVTSPWQAGEAAGIWLDDLIDVAQAAGSAPIYSVLKRVDEREVTMRAFDNPAFVEDIVRDVVVALRQDVRVATARVRARNQESIHDHSAVAQVRWSRVDAS